MQKLPDISYLRSMIAYDPLTGVLTWKPSNNARHNTLFANKVAGTNHGSGCLGICITQNGKTYRLLAHRVAWAIQYGEWPAKHVDHIDRNPRNNKLANLRDVTPMVNRHNSNPRPSSCGIKGVKRRGDSWLATADLDGKRTHLGTFKTMEEARIGYENGVRIALESGKQLIPYVPKKAQTRSSGKIDHETLLSLMHYDPNDGSFYRRYKDGTIANYKAGKGHDRGYQRLACCNRYYYAHVLAWFYVYGVWPKGLVDHCDGNRRNNAISNLRDVDASTNALNVNSPFGDMRGIQKCKLKSKEGWWEVAINIQLTRYAIGVFPTIEDARNAWLDATNELCPGVIMRNNTSTVKFIV